ncbi:hypothetical protein Glove_60g120 [Diversispora epigaea]|uniref:Uncharacterized protein n=1 Tax=Diversispora epigaea TaxID=1348612 RepID=A0A397JBM1_9GLOM|nr:hypothetical protein Glove_60g120 [Diversispora epigaea]
MVKNERFLKQISNPILMINKDLDIITGIPYKISNKDNYSRTSLAQQAITKKFVTFFNSKDLDIITGIPYKISNKDNYSRTSLAQNSALGKIPDCSSLRKFFEGWCCKGGENKKIIVRRTGPRLFTLNDEHFKVIEEYGVQLNLEE